MFQKAAKAWEVAHAAAYLLFLTKSYVAYCGNESQIMIYWDRGGFTTFPNDPMRSISLTDMEKDFKALQLNLRQVFLGLVNFDLKDGEYNSILKGFADRASEMRSKHSHEIQEFIRGFEEEQERAKDESESST